LTRTSAAIYMLQKKSTWISLWDKKLKKELYEKQHFKARDGIKIQ
jgi:hypothetical protein